MRRIGLGWILITLMVRYSVAVCPAGWTVDELSPRCLHYVPTEATFQQAQVACRQFGGDLVFPQTNLDTAGLTYYIQTAVELDLQKNVWVDLVNSNNNWTSADGEQVVTPIPWYEGYPEDNGNCALLMFDIAKIKNRHCERKMPFICASGQGEAPQLKLCSEPPPVPEATLSSVVLGAVVAGSYVYVSCPSGFSLSSSGYQEVMCSMDGSWSHTQASMAYCKADSCGDIDVGEMVVELTGANTEPGAVRNYTCPDGHKLNTNSAHYTVTCHNNGNWITLTGERAHNSQLDCEKESYTDDSVNSSARVDYMLYLSVLAVLASTRIL